MLEYKASWTMVEKSLKDKWVKNRSLKNLLYKRMGKLRQTYREKWIAKLQTQRDRREGDGDVEWNPGVWTSK